jgi:hypothetical protein
MMKNNYKITSSKQKFDFKFAALLFYVLYWTLKLSYLDCS